jgi:DNA-directed RNA polymerase specialized sigma24 family protein
VIVELPPSYRAVVLRDMEELTTEETAQILDLARTVKPASTAGGLQCARS